MLTLLGTPRRCCDGITRRETLKAGALSLLGGYLNLPSLLAAQSSHSEHIRPGKAKNVILLYLLGGAPTQDMWDLKPNAPDGVRGEFKPIATSAPGVQICDHLPGMAKWMHKAAIVRSLNHKAGCHNTMPSFTGDETPGSSAGTPKDTDHPGVGSVCELLKASGARPSASGSLPAYVYVPMYLGWGQLARRPGPYGGFLGKRCDPLFTEAQPYIDNPPEKRDYPQVLRGEPTLPNSVLGNGVTLDRLDHRRSLLEQFDGQLRGQDAAVGSFDRTRQRAFDLLTARSVKSAFDLRNEDPKVRDRYGRYLFGNCALIARRLIEAGVRFVNVTWDCYWERLALQNASWDFHYRQFGIMREYNLPWFDLTYTGLMQDLHDHGLLDETLVVIMSEMGRHPKVNADAGRDHWTYCYSVMFAGAGIRGGTVYGASDSHAAFVKDKPVSTADICATIYECLGIDPDMPVYDRANRPHAVANGGKAIRDILA